MVWFCLGFCTRASCQGRGWLVDLVLGWFVVGRAGLVVGWLDSPIRAGTGFTRHGLSRACPVTYEILLMSCRRGMSPRVVVGEDRCGAVVHGGSGVGLGWGLQSFICHIEAIGSKQNLLGRFVVGKKRRWSNIISHDNTLSSSL